MQYCKDIPAADDIIVDFNGPNATDSLNFKTKITGKTAADNNNDNIAGRIDAKITVPLKYISNFWRTFEMPLINSEIKLILDWSANYVIIYTNSERRLKYRFNKNKQIQMTYALCVSCNGRSNVYNFSVSVFLCRANHWE